MTMNFLNTLKARKWCIQNFISDCCKNYKIWIIAGTIPIKTKDPKVRAATLVFNDQGDIVCRYDKIHLFDVKLPEFRRIV